MPKRATRSKAKKQEHETSQNQIKSKLRSHTPGSQLNTLSPSVMRQQVKSQIALIKPAHQPMEVEDDQQSQSLLKFKINEETLQKDLHQGEQIKVEKACENHIKIQKQSPEKSKQELFLKSIIANQKEESTKNFDLRAKIFQKIQLIKRSKKNEEVDINARCHCGKFFRSLSDLNVHLKVTHNGQTVQQILEESPAQAFKRHFSLTNFEMSIVENYQQVLKGFPKQVYDLVRGRQFKYNKDFLLTNGTENMRGMASSFMKECIQTEKTRNLASCYFNYISAFMTNSFGQNFFDECNPKIFPRLANQYVLNYDMTCEDFQPMTALQVLQLTRIICDWMFRNGWSNDKVFSSRQISKLL